MPPVTIVFGFPASEGRVENLPEKVPTSLRGIPPRRQSQYAIAPASTGYCGSVKPVYAKDEDIEDLLFLSTDLFDDLDLAKRAVAPGGELAEVYERCANAAFYAIDLPASATRTASSGRAGTKKTSRKAASAKASGRKPGSKKPAAKKPAAKKAVARKSAKQAARPLARKTSAKKPMAARRPLAKARKGPATDLVGRAGIPRKKPKD
jgi:hypothetical protein